jgi:class 3 adenylate cyclase/pimeloyl-ACP methyl ester carboxylesterase
VVGSGPLDLVYLTGRVSNVDVRWEDRASAKFLDDLARFSRLIVFDRRGAGASDQLAPGVVPTWEEWAEDLGAVVDAAESSTAAIFAVADGGSLAVAYAAAHPERVRAAVLFNGLSTVEAEGSELDAIADLMADVAEELWGTEEYVKFIAPSISDDAEQSAWWAKYMRATATPRATAAQTRATTRFKIDGLLPLVQAPTLVMARSEFRYPPVEVVRRLAAQIPNVRVEVVPGTDAMPQTEHGNEIVDIVQEFLTGVRPSIPNDRFLATVLFTDIVDSTRLGSDLGDHGWRERLDAHDAMVRLELDRHRGREIKTTGDGFLATFDGPGRAVQCACAIAEGAHRLGMQVRSGLHAGEVEGRGDDITGIAVNIAARVAALAGPSEILVSRTITDLVAGSGLQFTSRGEHALKGVPSDWQLFAVEP